MKEKEAMMSNRFYMNEYSLRGQFSTVDEFSKSMQEKTLPLLKKIQNTKGAVFWKKSNFWQAKICSGCTLESLRENKHVSYAVTPLLKIMLQKILYSKPYWDEENPPDIVIENYEFDEEYRDVFEKDNCFLRALSHGDNIVSFWHSAYSENYLCFSVKREGKNVVEKLHNLACVAHWPQNVAGRHWMVTDNVRAFIRIKETDKHIPHFHVECEGYAGSFDLYTGEVLSESGNSNTRSRISSEIRRWQPDHLNELLAAWLEFHG